MTDPPEIFGPPRYWPRPPALTSCSEEVAEHHARAHLERCPAWWLRPPGADVMVVDPRPCPCGYSTVYVCAGCQEPLFLTVVDPEDVCPHGRVAIEVLM